MTTLKTITATCIIVIGVWKAAAQDGNAQHMFRTFYQQAVAGNADAQVLVAMQYFKGSGVPQDPKEGVKWIQRAAIQGHLGAQRTLSIMSQQGNDVVPKNLVLAYMWSDIASRTNDPAALRLRLGQILLMTPEQIALAKELASQFKPVKEGRD
ncbi:MAG: sel1 repeat family protein [Prosthecobacter sp.]|nr:sel1 repeat family protein [Prosthecobacter sp.]